MGESPIASKNIDIATTVLLGIPKMTRGTPQVQVTFEVNNECNITTQAVETQSLEKIVVVSAVTYANLTESSITLTLAKAQSTKFSDYLLLKSIEVVNKAGPLISRAEVILREADHKDISEALAALGLALDGDNVEEKARMVEELERLIPQRSGGEFQGFGSIWDFSKPASTLFDIWDFEMSIVDAPLVDRPTTNKPRPSATASNIGKIFGGGEFTQDPNLCFVLMPSDAHLKPIYDDHIHQVVESEGLSCVRADEIVSINTITWEIWKKINRSRIIIADLTEKNPNVFYEVGLAHALGKDVVLLTQTMDDVPFDLKAQRCIVYTFTPYPESTEGRPWGQPLKKLEGAPVNLG